MARSGNKHRTSMYGVYAIIDVDACAERRVDACNVADQLIASQPCAVQLRHKSGSSSEILSLGRRIATAARRQGVPFYLNDRPDLAMLCGATGVHVGQADLPLQTVRRRWPALRVGVSTHHREQLAATLPLSPDYVALGPIFNTASKKNPEPSVGLALLREAGDECRRLSVPLVAIGGLSMASVPDVAPWAGALAFISALHAPSPREVTSNARGLTEAIRAAQRGAGADS